MMQTTGRTFLAPVREALGSILLPVREAGGGGHWVTITSDEGIETHIFITGGGRVSKGPAHLIGANIAHLPAAPHRTVTHHAAGHVPTGHNSHPDYTEHEFKSHVFGKKGPGVGYDVENPLPKRTKEEAEAGLKKAQERTKEVAAKEAPAATEPEADTKDAPNTDHVAELVERGKALHGSARDVFHDHLDKVANRERGLKAGDGRIVKPATALEAVKQLREHAAAKAAEPASSGENEDRIARLKEAARKARTLGFKSIADKADAEAASLAQAAEQEQAKATPAEPTKSAPEARPDTSKATTPEQREALAGAKAMLAGRSLSVDAHQAKVAGALTKAHAANPYESGVTGWARHGAEQAQRMAHLESKGHYTKAADALEAKQNELFSRQAGGAAGKAAEQMEALTHHQMRSGPGAFYDQAQELSDKLHAARSAILSHYTRGVKELRAKADEHDQAYQALKAKADAPDTAKATTSDLTQALSEWKSRGGMDSLPPQDKADREANKQHTMAMKGTNEQPGVDQRDHAAMAAHHTRVADAVKFGSGGASQEHYKMLKTAAKLDALAGAAPAGSEQAQAARAHAEQIKQHANQFMARYGAVEAEHRGKAASHQAAHDAKQQRQAEQKEYERTGGFGTNLFGEASAPAPVKAEPTAAARGGLQQGSMFGDASPEPDQSVAAETPADRRKAFEDWKGTNPELDTPEPTAPQAPMAKPGTEYEEFLKKSAAAREEARQAAEHRPESAPPPPDRAAQRKAELEAAIRGHAQAAADLRHTTGFASMGTGPWREHHEAMSMGLLQHEKRYGSEAADALRSSLPDTVGAPKQENAAPAPPPEPTAAEPTPEPVKAPERVETERKARKRGPSGTGGFQEPQAPTTPALPEHNGHLADFQGLGDTMGSPTVHGTPTHNEDGSHSFHVGNMPILHELSRTTGVTPAGAFIEKHPTEGGYLYHSPAPAAGGTPHSAHEAAHHMAEDLYNGTFDKIDSGDLRQRENAAGEPQGPYHSQALDAEREQAGSGGQMDAGRKQTV